MLSFFGSAARADIQAMLAAFRSQERMFNDGFAAFFGVRCDAEDEKQNRITQRLPGLHLFWDPDGKVPALYGLTGEKDGKKIMHRVTYVLDNALRVLGIFPISEVPWHARAVMEFVSKLPPHPEFG